MAPQDLTGERRWDPGSLELQIGARLGVPRVLELATRRLVFLVADQLLVVEALRALELALLDLEGGARPLGLDALLVVLEHGEGLSLGNAVTFLHQQLADHSLGARDHRRVLVGSERRAGRVDRGDRTDPVSVPGPDTGPWSPHAPRAARASHTAAADGRRVIERRVGDRPESGEREP